MTSSFDERLSLIGFSLGGWSIPTTLIASAPDIEETLLDAVREVHADAGLFSLLLSWIKVHGAYVIVEKLRKIARRRPEKDVAWLAAVASFAVELGIPKWKVLARRMSETLYLYPQEITESAIGLKGAVPWLDAMNYRVPERSVRIREADALKPEALARFHRQYRNRYLYGPSWRADIITAIEEGARTPTEIAKRTGCSYEPAHRVFREQKVAGRA